MMIRFIPLLLTLALVGCNSSATNAPVAEGGHDHEHAHASGPHGGDVLELGEYHGELVHDDATGTVTVYVLDGALEKNVPVDAAEAVINVTREGASGQQFKLAASPMDGETEGFSSRFISSDPQLVEELDNEGAAAVFAVAINGEQHRAMIEHHHDHDHDHAHADETGAGETGHDEADHDHQAEAGHDHDGTTAAEPAEHADEAAH
jgi:hypothetical protein